MANYINGKPDFDLYSGIGVSPTIRDQALQDDHYQGSFSEYGDAHAEASRLRQGGDIDWFVIMHGETNYAGWQSGLTGPRQRQEA